MLNLKKNLIFFCGVLFAAAFVFGAVNWQKTHAQTKNNTEEFHQNIRNALAEINLPTTNNVSAIDAVAENLANFIFYRSGIQLSQTNKDLLRELEQKSWNQSKKINRGHLIRLLSDLAIEKITNTTDAELEEVAKILSGFDAPDYPERFKGKKMYVRLRASGAGTNDKEEFIEQAKVLRDTIKSNKIVQSFVVSAIDREIEQRIRLLAAASPQDFGNSTADLTPAQAILITYAIVADDVPQRNQKALQQMMEVVHKAFSRNNQFYPSPQGYRAYGANGYLFSSPANLLLDDATMTKILNGIKEKSKIQ